MSFIYQTSTLKKVVDFFANFLAALLLITWALGLPFMFYYVETNQRFQQSVIRNLQKDCTYKVELEPLTEEFTPQKPTIRNHR
jgi:hypothetical protein